MQVKSARAEGRRKVTIGPTHSSKWRCSSSDHPFISLRSPFGSGDPSVSRSYHLRDFHTDATIADEGAMMRS
jgi:hypothetical protein